VSAKSPMLWIGRDGVVPVDGAPRCCDVKPLDVSRWLSPRDGAPCDRLKLAGTLALPIPPVASGDGGQRKLAGLLHGDRNGLPKELELLGSPVELPNWSAFADGALVGARPASEPSKPPVPNSGSAKNPSIPPVPKPGGRRGGEPNGGLSKADASGYTGGAQPVAPG
jgi:hypothetical protein